MTAQKRWARVPFEKDERLKPGYPQGVGIGSLRTFVWWFGMGCLTTLGVLMVQGALYDLFSGNTALGTSGALSTVTLSIVGGGILAGSLALIMNRLRR